MIQIYLNTATENKKSCLYRDENPIYCGHSARSQPLEYQRRCIERLWENITYNFALIQIYLNTATENKKSWPYRDANPI